MQGPCPFENYFYGFIIKMTRGVILCVYLNIISTKREFAGHFS